MAKKTNLRSLWVAEEGTFGTDPDASGAAYSYLHADSEIPAPMYDMVANAVQNDRLTQTAPDVGRMLAKFGFKIPLRANGSNAGAAAAAPESDLVLKHCVGTVTRGTGSTVTAGATTTSVPVTSAAGFTRGGYCVVNVAGVGYLRLITKIVTNTLTVFPALPGAPAAAQVVYAANYYTPADSGVASLAFAVKIDDVIVTLLGCKAEAKIAGFSVNGRPLIDVSVEADSFVIGGKASLPAANDRFPAVPSPIVKGSPFIYGPYTVGTDSYAPAQKLVSGIEFDIGRKTQFAETTEALNGRSGFDVVDRSPKLTAEAYYDAGFLTDMGAGTDLLAAIGVGTSTPATTGWGLAVLKGRMLTLDPADRSGLFGQKVTIGAFDFDATPEFVLSVF